jgi:organic radical activating enzyme
LDITFQDWPDDKAVYGSYIHYMSGCDFSCKGCHNNELQKHTDNEFRYYALKPPVKHIVLSGGDPLAKGNKIVTAHIVKNLLHYGYAVTIYTGNNIEATKKIIKEYSLEGVSYFKCGQWDETLKQESGHRGGKFYLASTNQTLISGNGTILSTNGVYSYKE